MGWLSGIFSPFPVFGGKPRSPKWRSVRENHLKVEPNCIGCGLDFNLEVHHVLPYHLRPEFELEPTNLVTLCRDCHWNIGHLRDWSLCNPHVVDDARAYLSRFQGARRK